jgi:hypothetical protein
MFILFLILEITKLFKQVTVLSITIFSIESIMIAKVGINELNFIISSSVD